MKDGRASKLAKSIQLKAPSRRTVWHEPELQYDGTEPPKAWLARLRQLKQIHGYNEKETLKIAKKCLKGDADLWFRIHHPQSFDSLRTGLHTRFASGPVVSVGKPSLPVPQSENHPDDFISDVPFSLFSNKFASPSRLSNGERSPLQVSNGGRSGSIWSVSPAKHLSREWPASVRSLNQTKCLGVERSLRVRSVIPSTQLDGGRSETARSMNPVQLLNGESYVSRKPVTAKDRSSLPAALSELNTSINKVTCRPESGNQAVGSRCYPKTAAAYGEVGFAKGKIETCRASADGGSRKKEHDTHTLGSDSLKQTSISMETVEANCSNKNIDTFSLSSMKLLFPRAVILYPRRIS